MPNPQIDKVNVNGTLYDIIDSTSPAASISASDITRWNGKISNTYVGYLDSTALYVPKNWFYDQYASTYSYCLFFYAKESVTINSNTLIREIESNSSIATLGNTIYLDGQNKGSSVILSTNRLYAYKYNDGISYIYTVANRSDIPTVPSNVSAFTNDAGYISSITSTDISNALGYTPTSNTGTVTSVALSDGGGLSINGSPITTSGTITIGHSNSVTAQTTQAVYPIKIDAQGHVSAYGTAVSIPSTAADVNAVAISTVGASSGVAPLNASGKIDSTYLPSYVDDVIEGYYYNNKFYKESTHTTEITGETGKIYIDLSTDKVYRYGGTAYAEIAQGSLVSVTRDLNSGTQIGTITINGTGTSLYAPTPPSKVSELSNDSGFITGISAADVSTALGYTPISAETDPVFSASPAAGISAADITSWNNKVSDDKTWNGVVLNNTTIQAGTVYIPGRASASATNAYNLTATIIPSAQQIALYDSDKYLKSTTPSSDDNSTKVATTAFVKDAIPSNVSVFSNDAGYISGITSTDVTTALGFTPTSNTGTVTSVAASAGTGISISGSPITTSGTITIGHSNSVTAQTTEAVYPIKIDAQGHISSYGSAVIIPSDTKVTQTPLNGANSIKGLLFANGTGGSTETNTVYTTDKIQYNDINVILYINNTTKTRTGYLTYNSLVLANDNNNYNQTLRGNAAATGNATVYLPSSGGTLALKSDIPTPYNSSTNPSGYLRLSDLPIYDGTVTTYAEGVSF